MKWIVGLSYGLVLLVVVLGFIFSNDHSERFYQKPWCDKMGGEIEITFDDGTRCDCLTTEYAIEVEWAYNWKESVGQALHYAIKAEVEPGIALILQDEGDRKYYWQLQKGCKWISGGQNEPAIGIRFGCFG